MTQGDLEVVSEDERLLWHASGDKGVLSFQCSADLVGGLTRRSAWND